MAEKRKKLSPVERRRAAERKMTRAQARTNKRVRSATHYVESAKKARVQGPGRSDWKPAKAGSYVRAGTRVRTAPGGSATFTQGKKKSTTIPSSVMDLAHQRYGRPSRSEMAATKKLRAAKKKGK